MSILYSNKGEKYIKNGGYFILFQLYSSLLLGYNILMLKKTTTTTKERDMKNLTITERSQLRRKAAVREGYASSASIHDMQMARRLQIQLEARKFMIR